ncbi:hypothetical protein LQZ19_04440 [Treponema primitia]|uniref:hypothetical protein n=1 Tax=Treponema primitia TaxID=88058 RepID=UPI003981073E
MFYFINNFDKNPTAHPNIIVVTITIGRPVGSSLYIKNVIGKTNKIDIIIPFKKEIDTKFIFGINNPKTIHTKNAEIINNLSIFLIIIGVISTIAAIKPINKEIK